MRYLELPPAPPLRRHVACYWVLDTRDNEGRGHRVLPDGCMDLLLRCEEDGSARALVLGAMSAALLVPAERARFVGVRFWPGEAFAFLDLVAAEARDKAVDGRDAGLTELEALLERAFAASSASLASVLDRWLLPRLLRARPSDLAVRRATALLLAARGGVRAAEVALAVGVSERTLERAFAERVGIPPKFLARVLRVQAFMQSLERLAPSRAAAARGVPWASLAAELGFADQAHLVRDVRALTGTTPGALLRERVSELFNTPTALSAKIPA